MVLQFVNEIALLIIQSFSNKMQKYDWSFDRIVREKRDWKELK
jgi:hypothetical protein